MLQKVQSRPLACYESKPELLVRDLLNCTTFCGAEYESQLPFSLIHVISLFITYGRHTDFSSDDTSHMSGMLTALISESLLLSPPHSGQPVYGTAMLTTVMTVTVGMRPVAGSVSTVEPTHDLYTSKQLLASMMTSCVL